MNTQKDRYSTGDRGSEPDSLDKYLTRAESVKPARNQKEPPGQGRKYIVIAILVIAGLFYFRGSSNTIFMNPVDIFSNAITLNEPSESLLNRMNVRMIEMGYTDLTHDDLRDLRSAGVTATYISNIRSLGFEDLTLEQAESLARADASSTFMAMMIELGYDDLEIEDFVRLRDANVTAHYTSNIHDLGYRDVTTDQLIRMRRIGVTTGLIERLQSERGEDLPLEDIIRHRISNQ